MTSTEPRFRQFRAGLQITVSATLSFLFAARAVAAGRTHSVLSGPGWTIVYALLAALFVVRCFDRVVVSPDGIRYFRVVRVRHLARDDLARLVVVGRGAGWFRLYAESPAGERTLVVAERSNAVGQARLATLTWQVQAIVGVPTVEQPRVPDPDLHPPPRTDRPRRCINAGCDARLLEVRTPTCPRCGRSTQTFVAG